MAAIDVIDNVRARFGYSYKLKPEQLEVISCILKGESVLSVLPTGYGKSDCFIVPPLVKEEMLGRKQICVVISPLRSLMLDTTTKLRAHGIRAASLFPSDTLDYETEQGLKQGEFTHVFASPEILLSSSWRSVLQSKVYKERVCLLVCDEAHCITEWGDSFRPAYKEVGIMCSLLHVPLLVTTATITPEMRTSLVTLLEMETYHTVAVIPERKNIFLQFKKTSNPFMDELQWFLDIVKSEKESCPKTIIYCNSITAVSDIFIELGVYRMETIGCMNIIQQFHSGIAEQQRSMVMEQFLSGNSSLRILVSTVAFGMGVSVGDVRFVIHWGLSSTVVSYWQEVGRAGRDGKPSKAFLYCTRLDTRRSNQAMIDICQNIAEHNACLRLLVLKGLSIPEMDNSLIKDLESRQPCENHCQTCACALCTCCSICKDACHCSS